VARGEGRKRAKERGVRFGWPRSCCPIAFAASCRSHNSSHALWLQAGEQDMTLHLTKIQKIGRVSEVLGWIDRVAVRPLTMDLCSTEVR